MKRPITVAKPINTLHITMTTKELFSILELHRDKTLGFEYATGKLVAPNYHITEVKHVIIDAVDCGTGTDMWRETVIQLWENANDANDKAAMSVLKAMGILKKVGRIKPYVLDAQVKFEYGNATFHTAQLIVEDIEILQHHIIIKLGIQNTNCKAKDACGIVAPQTVIINDSCCTPNSGCC